MSKESEFVKKDDEIEEETIEKDIEREFEKEIEGEVLDLKDEESEKVEEGEEKEGEGEEEEEEEIELDVQRKFVGHESSVVSVLYFYKTKRIVSSSMDRTIRIWDIDSGKCLHVLKFVNCTIYSVVKLNSRVFLSSFSDNRILAFSIENPKTYIKGFKRRSSVLSLLRITYPLTILQETTTSGKQSLFATLNRKGEMCVIDYENDRVIRKLGSSERIWELSKMILSKKNASCLYLNTDDDNKSVKCFNFDTCECVNVFDEHDRTTIKTMCVFLNSKNEEILVCGGSVIWTRLYIYRTCTDTKKPGRKPGRFLLKKIRMNCSVWSSVVFFRNKHLCIGDGCGKIHIYSLQNYKKIFKGRVHEGYKKIIQLGVFGVEDDNEDADQEEVRSVATTNPFFSFNTTAEVRQKKMKELCSKKLKIQCLSCCEDGTIRMFEIKNLYDFEDLQNSFLYENTRRLRLIIRDRRRKDLLLLKRKNMLIRELKQELIDSNESRKIEIQKLKKMNLEMMEKQARNEKEMKECLERHKLEMQNNGREMEKKNEEIDRLKKQLDKNNVI